MCQTTGSRQLVHRVSAAEAAVIDKIVDRAMGGNACRSSVHRMATELDIIMAHANGNPLRLESLLYADDSSFADDIYGISRHLNRATGELKNGFRPRYAA